MELIQDMQWGIRHAGGSIEDGIMGQLLLMEQFGYSDNDIIGSRN